MKNKKGAIELNVGTIVTIFLLMAILILGVILIQIILDKPEFTITKEVCDEGYNFNISANNSHHWTNFDVTDIEIKYDKENNYISGKFYSCKQVEVDGVEYEDLNGRTCLKELGCYRKTKDITIEWLDDNCDCLNSYCLNKDGDDILCNDGIVCSKISYKCGDYFVEVK